MFGSVCKQIHSIMAVTKLLLCVLALSITVCYCILWFSDISKESRAFVYRLRWRFIVTFAILTGSMFIWRQIRLTIDSLAGDNERLKRVCRLALTVFMFMSLFSYTTEFFLVSTEPYLFVWICFSCLGFYVFLLASLILTSIVHVTMIVLLKLWRGNRGYISPDKLVESKEKKPQREHSRIYKTLIAFTISIICSMYALHHASMPPVVKTVNVPIKGLPKAMEDFKIIQLSDIHLGPTVGKKKLQTIVDIVDKLHGDAVVMVGDFVDASVHQLKDTAQPLTDIKAKHGKYFVSGNHEYYTRDVDGWFAWLGRQGWHVLHNEHVVLPDPHTPGHGVCLAGVDDLAADSIRYAGHGVDIARAVGGCAPTLPILLLAHQPRVAMEALQSNANIQLVISGHTHGGQIFPFLLGAYLLNPFYAGLYEHRGRHVYVSMGTMYWGVPMRLGTTAEVTQIILKSAI